MIENRPTYLTEDPGYAVIPSLPIGLDLDAVPNWVKVSMLFLGGVQPITVDMVQAADFVVEDQPSQGELDLYRRKGTRFQIVSVVTSIAAFRRVDGDMLGVPYAISLVPGNKRGTTLSNVDVDYVRTIDLNFILQSQSPCYVGFNPFSGHYAGWGAIDVFLGETPLKAYPDELGLVTDMFFLQLDFDPQTVTSINLGLGEGKPFQKYLRHRSRLMYSPFQDFRARRIWGAESPIELFLFQALLREGLMPNLQMLLFEDGSAQPSLYDLWVEDLSDVPGLITETDLYFPEQRLAVFCDSTRHHRGEKAARKDERVTRRLEAAGIQTVRLPGSLIVRDLKTAVAKVLEALQ